MGERRGGGRAEGNASPKHHALFAQGGEDAVAFADGKSSSNWDGLLSLWGAIETDAALALKRNHARVEQAQPPYLAVRTQEGGLGQERVRRWVRAAVVAKDTQERNVRVVVAQVLQRHDSEFLPPPGLPRSGVDSARLDRQCP